LNIDSWIRQDEQTLRSIFRFKQNPYMVLADLATLVCFNMRDVMSEKNLEQSVERKLGEMFLGSSICKSLKDASKQGAWSNTRKPSFPWSANKRWSKIWMKSSLDGLGDESALTAVGDESALTAVGDESALTAVLGFVKDFGIYLAGIESYSEFQGDLVLNHLLFSERYQKSLGEYVDKIKESDPTVSDTGVEEVKDEDKTQLKDALSGLSGYFSKGDTLEELYKEVNGRVEHIKHVVVGRHYEIWIETMATCCCILNLFGRRHEETWTRVLELSQERTHGIPHGVCAYKMAGDVYRKSSRFIREKDERVPCFNPKQSGDKEDESFGVIQRSFKPLLLEDDEDESDLTPMPYRLIGAEYFKFQFRKHLEILEDAYDALGAEELQQKYSKSLSVQYIIDKDELRPVEILENKEIKVKMDREKAFYWLGNRRSRLQILIISGSGAKAFLPVVLGIDKGVYTVLRGKEVEIPYTMRSTTDDYHGSMRRVYSNLVRSPANGGGSSEYEILRVETSDLETQVQSLAKEMIALEKKNC